MSYELRVTCEENYCGTSKTECPERGIFNWDGKHKPACLAHQTVLVPDTNERLFRCWMCKKLEERITEEPSELWEKDDH